MDIVVTIIAGLLILTVLVVAHEFGHFSVGKACGIRIEEFSVGFGPKLLSKIRKKDQIRYSIRALPLGGYVQFYGEDEEVEGEPRAFNNRPPWQRFLTLLAGPMMNVIVAIVVTAVLLMSFGDYVYVVNSTNSQAMEELGFDIQPGDRVVEVNGKRIDFAMEVSMASLQAGEENGTYSMGLERDGVVRYFSFNGVSQEEMENAENSQAQSEGEPLLKWETVRRHFGFFEALGLSFKWLFLIVGQMLDFLAGLIFRGQGAESVAGPVGIFTIIGEAMRTGTETVLRITALLSINLAVMNLLPLPALDGGRILFLGIEKLRGKPISRKVEGYINMIGLLALFGLMILLTYQDIARLITGGA